MGISSYIGLFDELEKIAEDQFTVVPKRWSSGQATATMAMREALKENPEIKKELLKLRLKGFLKGTAIGAGAGAGIGAGISLLSRGKIPMQETVPMGIRMAGSTGILGALHAGSDVEKRILAERGVQNTFGGLGRGRFRPGTMEKYLTEKQLEKEKTAEEQRKDVTKDRFKRHLKAMAAVGLMTGLGAGAGGVAKRSLLKHKGRVGDLLRRHPKAARFAPVAVGALGAGIGGYMGKSLTKQHFNVVEKGDERDNK